MPKLLFTRFYHWLVYEQCHGPAKKTRSTQTPKKNALYTNANAAALHKATLNLKAPKFIDFHPNHVEFESFQKVFFIYLLTKQQDYILKF